MSDITEFKKQFADWEWILREEGETEQSIEEIRQYIRDHWGDLAWREDCKRFVAEKSKERQELIAMARGITERVKQRAEEAKQ